MATKTHHKFRISEAAICRVFLRLNAMLADGEISPEKFAATSQAVNSYILDSRYRPTSVEGLDLQAWKTLRAEIDRCAKRSAVARARRKPISEDTLSGNNTSVKTPRVSKAQAPRVSGAQARTWRHRLRKDGFRGRALDEALALKLAALSRHDSSH